MPPPEVMVNVETPKIFGTPEPVNMDQNTEFWTTYLKEANLHDRDMIACWNDDLDMILIFVCIQCLHAVQRANQTD